MLAQIKRMGRMLLSGRRLLGTMGALAVCAAAVGLVAFLCRSTSAQQGQNIQVEVRGVRVVGDGYGEGMAGLRPFNWSKGTTLAILVLKPDGGLVALDAKASKLDRFADDKGTDLLAAKAGRGSRGAAFEGFGMPAGQGTPGIGDEPRFSTDGKACMVELESGVIPAGQAREILASGTLAFQCGTQKKTFKHENLALRPGALVRAGGVTFTITMFEKPDREWGEKGPTVTLTTKQDTWRIAVVEFLDAAGRQIKSSEVGRMCSGFGDQMEEGRIFQLERDVNTATLAITYWVDLKEVKVPFSLKASVGL